MRVDHLYVLPIFASPDKKLETQRSAAALFRRHAPKSRSAALIEISDLWKSTFKSELVGSQGDHVPLGPGIHNPKAPPDSPTVLRKSQESQGEKEDGQKGPEKPAATVGLYLVFHSDGGGMVLNPEEVAEVVSAVVPKDLHASITKVSLFACDIADRGEGEPIDTVFGKSVEKVNGSRTLIGGLAIMTGLLQHLGDRGIRPMICGYDVPIFAGDGPIKNGKPMRAVKKQVDGQWVKTSYDDPDIDGRKLVIHKKGRQSLAPIKELLKANPEYKNLHKKVLRLDNDGRIANALAGWSDK